ncbi:MULTISPECIES: AAA family ATPase [unclassified Moraxella]|uniref:AAA family ATPase n=1 Tax=unclassified Moraxella TaxID=2685852 RepID=UPI003AF5915B
MRLKQLKLAGFKSFANPSTFHFPKNITAIVGPNGCGKSNVIDAIRWVLGESSAKQLRGGAMSDVIFAGTQDKPAKSLASVELVFEHTQGDEDGKGGIHHPLNLYHELSVRRQMSKDGKSDYFINGTKVRRRDVVDIFLGTGLGARSYAVIEQGMIGRIIDANALQLREFIEEASGVSRYQSRREETQKQLTTAEDNLARLHDMASELAVQQKRLESQAKTAKLAQTWQTEMDNASQQLLIDDYGQAWQKQQQLQQEFGKISQQVTAKKTEINQLMSEQQTAQRHISEQQLAYQHQQNLAGQHWQQHHEAQSLVTQADKQLENDNQRLTVLTAEISRFADYQQQLTEQKQQAQQKIVNLPQQLSVLTEQINRLRDEQHELKNQRQDVASELVKLNQQKQDLEKQLAVAENGLKHHDSNQQRLKKREQEHAHALQTWQTAKAQFDSEFADFDVGSGDGSDEASDSQLAKLTDTIERLENRIIARQEELADQADEVESLTRQHRQLEQQRHTWQTEQQTLQNLLDRLNEQEQQAKQTLAKNQKNANDNSPTLPLLAHTLTLTEQGKTHVETLDSVLALMANWAVFDNDLTNANLNFNQFNQAVTLFSQKQFSQNQSPSTKLIDVANWLKFSDLIQSPSVAIFERIWLYNGEVSHAEFEAFFAQIQPQLAEDWLLVKAEEILYLLHQTLVINLSALIADLHSDKKNQTTPTLGLSQKIQHQTRIDELQNLIDKQKPQLERVSMALQQATVSLEEWQAQDRTARQELTQLMGQKQSLATAKIQREHRYQSAFDKLQNDKQRLDTDEIRLTKEKNSLSNNISQEQQKVSDLGEELATLKPILHQKIETRQQLDEQLQTLTTQQRTLEQQQQGLNQQLATGQLQITVSEQQLAKAEQDQARIQAEHSELQQKIHQQTEQLPILQQHVNEQAENLATANQTLQQLAEKLAELEQHFSHIQQAFHAEQASFANLQQQCHTTDTALALAKQTLGLIVEQFGEREWALPNFEHLTDKTETAENADNSQTLSLLGKTERKTLQNQINQLKSQIQQLGAVNHTAMAELTEVNSRLEPLAEQISDLTASIDKLQQAIKQIDSQTKALFLGMLADVNLELNRLFTQVFGGGKAELILSEDGADGWQSGLELMAQPKGKKNSRLALLSGGEKTLTALSLVFAIFKQQPAPFCVLDEVDAPLDDANVERFTRLIEQLAKDVQFIFISHNKLSMQIADELKGVTMPIAGISKLVSVDMSEVADYLQAN